ncbi:FAD-dependent oxidoreductase [Actinoplanes solisilvae]|uniref:FAD-dependent oxidoreductase n=1 Tax=Actinoplanes solisilvae TaxID=2486853 RepID=UPI000FDB0B5A|nr:FAD-dependent oxidoreductase [Actinoplanes solisilvae]
MTVFQDVIVVGGGAMGSAAAWSPARRGTEVTLLERFSPGHAFGASHGASRIFRLAYAEPDYIALARRALDLWRSLEAETGTSLLDLTGGVDHGLVAPITEIADALAAAGVPGQWLQLGEAAARWPGLRFTGPVFFHPSSGRLHADNAVAALQKTVPDVRYETPVLSVTVRGDDHVEVVTPDGALHARRVVVAAGAWTPKLLPGLLSVRVTQEQPAHFVPLDPAAEWPSFIHHRPSLGVYGLATPGEGIKAGFHGTGPETDPDHRDFAEEPVYAAKLRDYVREWIPGVDPDAATPISCTYTTTPTSDFVIDRAGPVVVAAGFSGHGFKFTPAVGELVADLVTGGETLPRFRLSREST